MEQEHIDASHVGHPLGFQFSPLAPIIYCGSNLSSVSLIIIFAVYISSRPQFLRYSPYAFPFSHTPSCHFLLFLWKSFVYS